MSGALTQLTNKGLQDAYLIGAPQTTFFMASYKRHTNFAIESLPMTPQGTVSFGQPTNFLITRTGDLASKMNLEITLPALSNGGAGTVAWVNDIAPALIQKIELKVGGTTIDTRYGEFSKICSASCHSSEQRQKLESLWGSDNAALTTPAASIDSTVVHYPLDFSCNTSYGLSLPCVALAYHEIYIVVHTRQLSNLVIEAGGATSVPVGNLGMNLYVDYIFLEGPERRAYALGKLEYLIEQVHTSGDISVAANGGNVRSYQTPLYFNHPVKDFLFVVQPQDNIDAKDYFNYTLGGVNQMIEAQFDFNATQRQPSRKADYYNKIQAFQHYVGVPLPGVMHYSLALFPCKSFPSGSGNMSRIDTIQFKAQLEGIACIFKIWARNYNIFRVKSGLGGIAFST